MSDLRSPPCLLPSLTPRRALSPMILSPTKRGRPAAGSDDALRDLSPTTTLRAFTEKPMPFDTSADDYRIFACIEQATAAEKDLGTRVAKAAQRLKAWCKEMEQWSWPGTFVPPTDEVREQRRLNVAQRISELLKDHRGDSPEQVARSDYWGSLLAVEVQAHEARLDDIGEELNTLEVEDLKEHVLGIHGSNRSRPSSRFDSERPVYNPLDDFSILITQTLLSSLPYLAQIRMRLDTWTARVSVLRETPLFLGGLQTSRHDLQLGWDALIPQLKRGAPDSAFDSWKHTIKSVSENLQQRLADLGRRLDRMLDALEGRDDCLPDDWIDRFEALEGDFGHWAAASGKRVLEVDLRRARAARREATEAEHQRVNTEDGTTDLSAGAKRSEEVADVHQTRHEPVLLASPPFTGPAGPTEEAKEKMGDQSDSRPGLLGDLHPEQLAVKMAQTGTSSTPPADGAREGSDGVSESSVGKLPAEPRPMDNVPKLDPRRPRTPEAAIRRYSVNSTSSLLSLGSSPPSVGEESPSVRAVVHQGEKSWHPPLNATMPKRRPQPVVTTDAQPPWPPTFTTQISPASTTDLEHQISSILDSIPAHIRLKSGPEADAPEIKSKRNAGRLDGRGSLRTTRSTNGMKSPDIILSPAKAEPGPLAQNAASSRRTAGARADNDIKLYHLSQPGKEHPIKLFIRRIGENGERVMVRVGGGWADLGEYLRQYAEHHGRRAVSMEGKFEVLGLEVKHANENSPRSGSSMGKRERRVSEAGSVNSTPWRTSTPLADRSVVDDASTTHSGPGTPMITAATPVPSASAGDKNNSSNETNASVPSTGSSRKSWTRNEVGLAGPKVKKLDLSDDKLEWIEGVLSQARRVNTGAQNSGTHHGHHHSHLRRSDSRDGIGRASSSASRRGQNSRAESRNESRTSVRGGEVGDLGTVGGTKRVFLKGVFGGASAGASGGGDH